MKEINLLFPNQLFKEFPFQNGCKTYLIEEWLFFNQYNFHKQKIQFHRASMKSYASLLASKKIDVEYIDAKESHADIRKFIEKLDSSINTINYLDPEDNWLNKRIKKSCDKKKIALKIHHNPLFINSKSELDTFFKPEKKEILSDLFLQITKTKFTAIIR